MRKSDESLGALITSLREQTCRLRRNLTSHPPLAAQASTQEFQQMKGLIDDLLQDNKTFHDEVDAHKQVLEAAVLKCKETQVISRQ